MTIGIYWANHISFFRMFVRTDHYFLMLNVFFLMAVAFLPFPTAVLGEYLDDDPQRKTAVAFYILGLVLPATGWLCMWLYARWDNLIDESLHPDYVRFLTLLYIGSFAIYLAALVIALWQPYVGLVITAVLTALYLLPPRPRQYITANDDPP